MSPRTTFIVLVLGILTCYVVGHYWMKHNVDKLDTQVHAERDPITMGMYKKIADKTSHENM